MAVAGKFDEAGLLDEAAEFDVHEAEVVVAEGALAFGGTFR